MHLHIMKLHYDRMNHSHIFSLQEHQSDNSHWIFHSNRKSKNNDTVHILHVSPIFLYPNLPRSLLCKNGFDDKYRHTRSYDRKPICFLAFQRSPSLQFLHPSVPYPFILQFFSLRSLGMLCIKRCVRREGRGIEVENIRGL